MWRWRGFFHPSAWQALLCRWCRCRCREMRSWCESNLKIDAAKALHVKRVQMSGVQFTAADGRMLPKREAMNDPQIESTEQIMKEAPRIGMSHERTFTVEPEFTIKFDVPGL